jgi:hypothetical protein
MSNNKSPPKINQGASSVSGMGAGSVIGTGDSKTEVGSCDILSPWDFASRLRFIYLQKKVWLRLAYRGVRTDHSGATAPEFHRLSSFYK